MYNLDWFTLGTQLAIVAAALAAGLVIHAIVFEGLRRFAARTRSALDDSFNRYCKAPLRILFPLLGLDLVMPSLKLSPAFAEPLGHAIGLAVIASIAWLLVRVINIVQDVVVEKFRIEVGDNLRARRIRTQFTVFRRVAEFVVFVVALGIALTTFDWAKAIGASVLASAGLAGLVVSMAARPAIENLIAGLQIAMTEPIRIEDVVIAENEWGWIEEITTTYVVVRTWDLRRLIVPLSYFIQHPFQNWTRRTANLLGYAYLYLDYSMPIDPLREEFQKVLQNSSRWDKKVAAMQVTDASEHTIQVRALMSAADSGATFDLRCEVREKLLDFVQRKYPQCLPKARAELQEIQARVLAPNGDGRAQASQPPSQGLHRETDS
jgi:small-conductance mechanosensitive channel